MNDIFDTEKGCQVYEAALRAISDWNMLKEVSGGVLIGLSGGADSVALLYLLLRLKEDFDFNLSALHVNHMIRGAEADGDENFCRDLCAKLGVPFYSYCVDVPSIAKKEHKSLEQAARDVRYRLFSEKLKDLGYSLIAVAHNATDNLETIILNMSRGSGIVGLSGIAAKRDNIIRPLIYVSKDDITSMLENAGVEYVTDKTNLSVDYKRNYVRHKIIPELMKICDCPVEMGTRVSLNLRSDIDFINACVDGFLLKHYNGDFVDASALASVHKSLFVRILAFIIGQKTTFTAEKTHFDAIYSHRFDKSFSYSLPGRIRFVIRDGRAFVEEDTAKMSAFIDKTPLTLGINKIDGYDSVVIISESPMFENYLNVYNIEISAAISFDIINNGLGIRSRIDGDAYCYGGLKRKLKRLFVDRKIPESQRANVPVIYDADGIVWVAGFGVRNEGEFTPNAYICIATPKTSDSGQRRFYITKRK